MNRFRSFLDRRRSADQKPQQLEQHPNPHASHHPPPPPATRPAPAGDEISTQAAAAGNLTIALVNKFPAGTTVYAIVSGRAISNNNALVLLRSDGRTLYYPANPASTMSPVNPSDVAIRLGNTGSTTTLTIPHIAGGRIYFSLNTPLKFFVNPGPALVEPAVANPSDPSIAIDWGFCEFTFNTDQLYANISYVDFVSSIPIALSLSTTSSQPPPPVLGLKPNGLNEIANALRAQHGKDGQGWDRLIVPAPNGSHTLRVLSPNIARVTNSSLLSGYFEPYVNSVWARYGSASLQIDTQAQWGVVTARIANNTLRVTTTPGSGSQKPIGGNVTFSRPSTTDILSCSTGPFATGQNPLINTMIPRLAAAFNRSTLLQSNQLPGPQGTYYKEAVTNHYSRVVHEWNQQGRGYAFPYDDVQPSGGAAGSEQSGEVHAGDPKVWTISVGGG